MTASRHQPVPTGDRAGSAWREVVSSWVMPVNVTALQCLAEELAGVGGTQKAHYGALWRLSSAWAATAGTRGRNDPDRLQKSSARFFRRSFRGPVALLRSSAIRRRHGAAGRLGRGSPCDMA